jgi:hypothetical protein
VCEHTNTSTNEVGEGLLGMSLHDSGMDLMLVHHVMVVGTDLTLVHCVTMDPYVLP